MKTCTAVTSRTPPGSRGHSCSPPVRLSQLLEKIKFSKHNKFLSFISSLVFVILSQFQKLSHLSNVPAFSIMLPSGFRNLFRFIHWPDTSLPGILLLNFVHLIKQILWPISLKMIRSYVVWADNTALLSVYNKNLFKCFVPIADFNKVWQRGIWL
jgi:hypothetical protein